MEEASVFKGNQSQTICLRRAEALPDHVRKDDVIAVDNTRPIRPPGQAWDAWFNAEGVSEDFMNERDQPEHQVRDAPWRDQSER